MTRQTNTGQMETGERADLTWHQLQRRSATRVSFCKTRGNLFGVSQGCQMSVYQKSFGGEDGFVKMIDITVKLMKETKLVIYIKLYDSHKHNHNRKLEKYHRDKLLLIVTCFISNTHKLHFKSLLIIKLVIYSQIRMYKLDKNNHLTLQVDLPLNSNSLIVTFLFVFSESDRAWAALNCKRTPHTVCPDTKCELKRLNIDIGIQIKGRKKHIYLKKLKVKKKHCVKYTNYKQTYLYPLICHILLLPFFCPRCLHLV